MTTSMWDVNMSGSNRGSPGSVAITLPQSGPLPSSSTVQPSCTSSVCRIRATAASPREGESISTEARKSSRESITIRAR